MGAMGQGRETEGQRAEERQRGRERKRHRNIGKERRGSGEESTESLESKVLDP
jgi:hypothetical protein